MWTFWLWLVKSTGDDRSVLEVAQNTVCNASQIRVSLCRMR